MMFISHLKVQKISYMRSHGRNTCFLCVETYEFHFDRHTLQEYVGVLYFAYYHRHTKHGMLID